MRIVHVVPDFGLGGVQKGGIVLAESMSRFGHEVHVIGLGDGPRFCTNTGDNLTHHVIERPDSAGFFKLINELQPDVIHMHKHAYPEGVLRKLKDQGPWTLVATPVFGRPPVDRGVLDFTKTCHVGIYTFSRFAKWLSLSSNDAVARGVGYVPITPFQASSTAMSALDPREQILARRKEFGIADDAFVVGRIGRQHVSKWAPSNPMLIDAVLGSDPRIVWLSVGFPLDYKPDEIAKKWPGRFINFAETSDFGLLMRVLSCLDLQLMFGYGECFASTICEAAGAGVPTIALATPLYDNGQAEQVMDGKTGFLVGSVPQAVARVHQLSESPEQLRALKGSTHQIATSCWNSDRAALDLLDLYEAWRSGRSDSVYQRKMIEQVEQFNLRYRNQMVGLMSRGMMNRMVWRTKLAAVDSWSVFQIGRYIKRVRNKFVGIPIQLDTAENWY